MGELEGAIDKNFRPPAVLRGLIFCGPKCGFDCMKRGVEIGKGRK